jgi:hypothetical protein
MKKFLAFVVCACLCAPLIAAGVNPTPDIHPLVSSAVAPLTITSAPPPPGAVGRRYGTFHYILGHSYTGYPLTASGGVGGYTWSATGLPPGLSILNAFYGGSVRCCVIFHAIVGTPTKAGTYTSVVTVKDYAYPAHHKSATYTIKIVVQ